MIQVMPIDPRTITVEKKPTTILSNRFFGFVVSTTSAISQMDCSDINVTSMKKKLINH